MDHFILSKGVLITLGEREALLNTWSYYLGADFPNLTISAKESVVFVVEVG